MKQNPNTLYISSACYSDNTKQLLEEIHERLRVSPNKAVKESFWELADDPLGLSIYDWIREQMKIADQHVIDALLYSVPKYTITPDGCKCEWGFCCNDSSIREVVFSHNFIDNPYSIIKLENEKEKEKMDAKRCDRCGKLYDPQEAGNYIIAYMPGKYVSKYERENYTEAKIKNDRLSSINVVYYGSNNKNPVELCPECQEKLKNFFESGKDETNVMKKAEE